MQLAGAAAPGRPWLVGIDNPTSRTGEPLCTIAIGDGAVATSGIAERGRHILDPFTGRAADALLAVTVVGPSLTEADAYATAAVAMGRSALDWLAALPDHEALVVDSDGRVRHTSGWRQLTLAADQISQRPSSSSPRSSEVAAGV
jgi:thiamine biosynthesis lipoprotein